MQKLLVIIEKIRIKIGKNSILALLVLTGILIIILATIFNYQNSKKAEKLKYRHEYKLQGTIMTSTSSEEWNR
jgi:hypothetical protein